MGHFRVPKTLTFETGLREQPFLFHENKNHIQINGFAISLALKQRLGENRK